MQERIKDEDGEKSYQGAILKNYSLETQEKTKKNLALLDEKMREHLAWADTMLLRSLLVLLETQTWVKCSSTSADSLLLDEDLEDDCSLAEVKEAMDHISTYFKLPLEAKELSFVFVQDEIEETVDYA